jgi:hypothetical protein
MAATVTVNGRTVVHKKSEGTSIAFPDICLTRCGPSESPIPYPNVVTASDLVNGAVTVKADGQHLAHELSFMDKSTGNEAGDQNGIASGTIAGKAEFISFSFDVTVEGKCLVRAMDQMIHNGKNTLPTPLMQPAVPSPEKPEPGKNRPGAPKRNRHCDARHPAKNRVSVSLKNVALETVDLKNPHWKQPASPLSRSQRKRCIQARADSDTLLK